MAAGMTERGVMVVDQEPGEIADAYAAIKLPKNWTALWTGEHAYLAAAMQMGYEANPAAAYYGWLADDFRPRTKGWDVELAQSAGRYRFAQADDCFLSHRAPEHVISGITMSAAMCWGGDLVRLVGRWAIPEGVIQVGIDTAWCRIIAHLDLCRYRPDVIVEHLTWREGRRMKDEVDFYPSHDADVAILNTWRHGLEPYKLIDLIRATFPDVAEPIHHLKPRHVTERSMKRHLEEVKAKPIKEKPEKAKEEKTNPAADKPAKAKPAKGSKGKADRDA